MSVMVIFPISAKLGISVYTGRDLVSDPYAKNKMDYALYAANGREWFVDNVLFHDYGNVYIFFAPGDFIAVTSRYFRHSSRQEITKEYILGIKNAIDYLAEHDETLYIKDSLSASVDFLREQNEILEDIYANNHWFFFIYPGWEAEARFGRLDDENSKGMVCMNYNHMSTIDAFGDSGKEGNFIRVYEDSCRKKGLKPILRPSRPYMERPEDYSDEDIDFFLECRFGDLDFNKKGYHTELYPTPEFVHVLDYKPIRFNERTFRFYKTAVTPGESRKIVKDSTLTLAVYPSELGPVGRIRSISKISKALYEANGREWFVDNLLFSPRMTSDLYFPADGLFCYRTGYTPDDEFVTGLAKAINLISLRNDTLCASVREWMAPYALDDDAVARWIEDNRQHYLFDDTWTAEIRTFGWDFQFKDLEKRRRFEPFMLEDVRLWTHFDNGTEEGRAFRNGYEKDCRDGNLKIIGDRAIGARTDYSDEDIDMFVDWIMKANDYYISLPLPTVIRPSGIRYWISQENECALTTKMVCRQ